MARPQPATPQPVTAPASPPPPLRLMRLESVMQATGLRRSTLYSLAAKGIFPAPFKLSPDPNSRAVAWDAAAVEAFIRDRIESAKARGTETRTQKGETREQ